MTYSETDPHVSWEVTDLKGSYGVREVRFSDKVDAVIRSDVVQWDSGVMYYITTVLSTGLTTVEKR